MNRHLSISQKIAIGYGALLLILLASIGFSIFQTARCATVTERVMLERSPRVESATLLLNGTNQTLAATRGLILLGETQFIEQLRIAWNDGIRPSLETLRRYSSGTDEKVVADLEMLLRKLKEITTRIENFQGKEENLPAHSLLFHRHQPNGDRIVAEFSRMANAERSLKPDEARRDLLLLIAEARLLFSNCRIEIRSFVLNGEKSHIQRFHDTWTNFESHLDKLGQNAAMMTQEQTAALESIRNLKNEYLTVTEKIFEIRQSGSWNESVALAAEGARLGIEIKEVITALLARERKLSQADIEEARHLIDQMQTLQWALLLIALISSVIMAMLVTRTITRKLAQETQQLQVASEQLRAASASQLQGVTEQNTATEEVSVTMTELASMAKNVMQRCQQVANLADTAVRHCEEGGDSVNEAQSIMREIKDHIEKIVQHMLDLGHKSQQINLAVEIIQELSDQTTILSFNAAIEAAAAGEHGQSFAVVAEQVGKLADRAKDAARDVKSLIENIQRSTNTTIMATEDALKAADRGIAIQSKAHKVMGEVVEKINITLEAAREIELSSSQQSTAATQVTQGIDNILTTSKQTERNAKELLSTSEMLNASASNLERI